MFTGKNGLDAIKDNGNGEEGRELGNGIGDFSAAGEDVANVVAENHDEDS